MAPALIILVGMAAMVLLVLGGMNVIDDANRRHGGEPSWLPPARVHDPRRRGSPRIPTLPIYEGRRPLALWTGRVAGLLVITVGVACAVVATGVAIVASIVASVS